LYGPPGTGKTTTIINLINAHQTKYAIRTKSNVIHLNASDDRGIDVVRVQISQFIKSKNLFKKGLKFVILDEIDYMTKTAQQALKHILQLNSKNVRMCLICNYISKIDDSLRNEFICVRFNQLPAKDIFTFVKQIATLESIDIDDADIASVQDAYGSDIRSIINFVQLHKNLSKCEWGASIITAHVLDDIHRIFTTNDPIAASRLVYEICTSYNIDAMSIIKRYFNHIIRTRVELLDSDFIDIMQIAIHNQRETEDIDMLAFVAISVRNKENTRKKCKIHQIL
jgi:replication factor C subunit 3/5